MSEAQIYDRGYRRYEGTRTGRVGALRSLVIFSVRQAFGIGRPFWHKIFPFGLLFFAYLPAVVFVGIAVLIPDEFVEGVVPTYASYYDYVVAVLFLFAGFVGPELLCSDRQTAMLGVYLASPLSRSTYVVGKALSTLLLVMVVTLGPPMLYLFARSLQDLGPSGFVDWIMTFGRIVVSSVVVGGFYSAVALAVSSLTARRAVASAATLLLIPGSAIVTEILVFSSGSLRYVRLLNLLDLPRVVVFRLFGETTDDWSRAAHPTAQLWLTWITIVGLCAIVVWYRYQRLLVRK